MLAKELNEEVLQTSEDWVTVTNADIATLKQKALQNERKRIRLCCHRDINDSLHEMLIVHTKGVYVWPHKHLNKSESIHVIEGVVDVVLLDEQGAIMEVIPMGDYLSGRMFYQRIETPIYHTFIIHSDFLVFQETTKGPFKKSDTIFASWAPEENNAVASQTYVNDLIKRIEKKNNGGNV